MTVKILGPDFTLKDVKLKIALTLSLQSNEFQSTLHAKLSCLNGLTWVIFIAGQMLPMNVCKEIYINIFDP
jgi:hypothetical protein